MPPEGPEDVAARDDDDEALEKLHAVSSSSGDFETLDLRALPPHGGGSKSTAPRRTKFRLFASRVLSLEVVMMKRLMLESRAWRS